MTDNSIRKLTMPKWGLTMTQGRVVKWLAQKGDRVAAGSEVVDVETEKIASAVEAPADGVLRSQIAKEGEVVPVTGLLGVIAGPDVPDDEIDGFIDAFLSTFVPENAEADGPAFERVEAAGRSLRYLRRGESGEPVLLLHGFGGDLEDWRFNHEDLATSHVVYALELPGHGESAKAVGDGTVGSLAKTVSCFMDAVGLLKVHLVGHSLGGAISLYLALTRPDRVSSNTLICSAGLGPEINSDYIDGFITARRRKEIKPHLQKLFADPSLVNRQLVDHVLKHKRLDGVDEALSTIAGKFIADGNQAISFRDRLTDISTPILVIWGEIDKIIPTSQARCLPSSIKVEIIQGSGHMVQVEAAGEVNRLIDAFLG